MVGYTPRQVDDMSFWEFGAAIDGWMRANGGEPPPAPPTPEEHDDLVRRFG